MNLDKLKAILIDGEEILIDKILDYAIRLEYAKYTSTLKEAWRMSIQGLSKSLIKVIEENETAPEMGPDIDYSNSAIAEFGIKEANLHRNRGVTLGMFLSFMKYYQQCYVDLINQSNLTYEEKDYFLYYIKRVFDFIELGFIVEWTGLSEQRKIKEIQIKSREIQNEKNKYLTVFESIYDPVILVNQKDVIENINSKAAEIFLGNTRSGVNYYGNLDSSSKLGWLLDEIDYGNIRMSNCLIPEIPLKTHNGIRIFQVKLTKMMDVSEKYNGAVLIFSDITERIEAERNKEKEEAVLRQRQRLESIGTLASGVAHEINNPLNGIINYGQLILDHGLEETDINEYAGEIIKESYRVSNIVKNLLEFSAKSGQSYNYANVNDIIAKSLSIIGNTIIQDQISLTTNIPDGLPEINCRSRQIQQVLINLLSNAREALNDKYMGFDRNKKIIISAEEFNRQDKKWIRISVRDNGNGIPIEIQQKIFDPFFTTKSRSEGTGLGLAVSYGIISDHKGEISFETKQGNFTVFKIDLPCDND